METEFVEHVPNFVTMPIERKNYQGLSKLEFKAKQVVEGFLVGLHKSPFHGFSVEFAEHRAYNPGQSTRHIDWKLFARTDKLYTKRFDEETNLRCQMILDVSSSMHYPAPSMLEAGQMNKAEFAVHAAAALVELLRRQRDAVGLSLFNDEVVFNERPKSNAKHVTHIMQRLERVLDEESEKGGKRTSATDALRSIAPTIHRRSLVVIFSDMLDNSAHGSELLSSLQQLRFSKHEVILFHVTDKKREFELELENRPYTFVDMETGEKVKADPTSVRDAYRQAMNKHWQDLKLACAQNRIDLVEADINKGFENIMLQFMAKRSKFY